VLVAAAPAGSQLLATTHRAAVDYGRSHNVYHASSVQAMIIILTHNVTSSNQTQAQLIDGDANPLPRTYLWYAR